MSLEKLREKLSQIAPRDVRRPNLPMAHALLEAEELLQLCRDESLRDAIVAVGLPDGFPHMLEVRIEAAREAEAEWAQVRDANKSSERVDLEEEAKELRRVMLRSARWGLRDNRGALSCLSGINKKKGLADVVQDLFDLAELYDENEARLARDKSFDPVVRRKRARQLAGLLSGAIGAAHLRRLAPHDLRNRAYTHLDALVSQIRAAARYAFQRDPPRAKQFTSRYRRRARKKRAVRG